MKGIKTVQCFIPIVFVILMIHVVALVMSPEQPKDLKKEVAEGRLFCFSDDREYWCELNDYCIKGGNLYVLFGNQGVLKIYDSDGAYRKSFAFYKTKGESALHIEGEYVYLFDQSRNYNVFSSGEWVDFAEHGDYGAYLQKLDTFISAEEQRKENEDQYYIRLASIYRQREGRDPVPVVKRPVVFAFFQGKTPFLVIPFWMIILFVLEGVSRKKVFIN